MANHSSPPLGYRTEVSGFARSELVTMPAWDSIAVLGDKIEPQPDGCWLWTGRTDDAGYGQYQGHFAGIESHVVHRIVYHILVGPIPEDHHLHHECHNRACCNPEHLSPMTPSDHMSHHARERWAS